MIVIYHNNRCSKSRLCLDLIKKSGSDYKVIEYLKEDLSVNKIKEIVDGLEGDIKDIVRTNEKEIKNVKIDFKNKESIIKLIAKYNICMQRPIIRVNKRFIICRPPEKVLKYIKV
jgi:arsenate reductase|tara:strand:+ start:642 stop:986 length:345 start_codon:yes stop_codon:yes gene_type:complete